MSKCVNCLKEINEKEAFCLTCHEEVLECAKKQISDLEAKLAESEADKKVLICDYESRITKHQELMSWLEHNNDEIKQQLAEKEQEIESLRENSLSKRIFKEKLIPSHCMEQYEKYEQQIDKLTKDKISFAVEQLEKVKENIKKVPITDFDLSGNFEKMYKQDAIRQIDNQIEELKGEE